jgi:hypothetical protein
VKNPSSKEKLVRRGALLEVVVSVEILLAYGHYHECWALVTTIYHVPLNNIIFSP